MNEKYLAFLTSKGFTEETFGALETAKQASIQSEFFDEQTKALEAKIAEKATSEEISALKSELISIQNKMAETVRELAIQIKENSESAKNGGSGEKSDLIKFVERENKSTQGWEKTTVKAAALMTTANVIPNVASGFNQLFGNYIDPIIHSAPKRRTFIMQLVDTQMAAGTENIWYVERVNEEGDAAFIAEGALKPLIDGEYQEKKAPVKEVAERWKMSQRLINHTSTVVSDFREHANELIELKMDDGVLTGDGTGNNLSGISALAAPFIVPTGLANYYPAANIFDVIMAVATYVRLNNFTGNLTCILNTVWEAKMFGVKEATTNAYILPSFVAPDGTRVGSVAVQFENGMDEDKIMLGDLKRFKVRIAEDVTYAEGYENDDFSKNLVSRKLEAFLGTYLPANYAGSIIYDDIATVLTAIEV